MLFRIKQDHVIAVHQQGVALKQNNERAFIPETEPRTAVAERVGVHAGSGVKRSTHATADIPMPRTGTRPGGGDPYPPPPAVLNGRRAAFASAPYQREPRRGG